MLVFYIVPDTVLRPLHLLLCHLILKTLLWRRWYYYPHFTDGETKAKNSFKTNKTGHTGGKSQSQGLHQTSGVRIWRLIAVLFCFSVPFYLGQIMNSKFYRMNNQASKCYLYYSHAYLLSHLVWYLGMCLVAGTKCSLSTTVLVLGGSPASSAFELLLWTCLAPRCHKTKTQLASFSQAFQSHMSCLWTQSGWWDLQSSFIYLHVKYFVIVYHLDTTCLPCVPHTYIPRGFLSGSTYLITVIV